jgi:hypothetical protein
VTGFSIAIVGDQILLPSAEIERPPVNDFYHCSFYGRASLLTEDSVSHNRDAQIHKNKYITSLDEQISCRQQTEWLMNESAYSVVKV